MREMPSTFPFGRRTSTRTTVRTHAPTSPAKTRPCSRIWAISHCAKSSARCRHEISGTLEERAPAAARLRRRNTARGLLACPRMLRHRAGRLRRGSPEVLPGSGDWNGVVALGLLGRRLTASFDFALGKERLHEMVADLDGPYALHLARCLRGARVGGAQL